MEEKVIQARIARFDPSLGFRSPYAVQPDKPTFFPIDHLRF